MVRKRIDPEEYEVQKREKSPHERLREYLEEFSGQRIVIYSNMETVKGDSRREIDLYHVSQSYDEMGQVLNLEDPKIAKKDHPKILTTKDMEVKKENGRIVITYRRQLPFRGMRHRAVPDLEVYIEKVS